MHFLENSRDLHEKYYPTLISASVCGGVCGGGREGRFDMERSCGSLYSIDQTWQNVMLKLYMCVEQCCISHTTVLKVKDIQLYS